VPELNVSAIASALEHCLNNLQEAKEMGEHARQLILEKYTWDRIASNLVEVYTAILKQEPLPEL